MCEGNLLRKHRKRGCSRDGKLQSWNGMFQFQKERGKWELASALQTAPTNRSSTATLGDIWRVEKRVMMLARARTFLTLLIPVLSAGWEGAKLMIFHLTILLAEEKSARGCCGGSRRRQRPGRLCAGGERWGGEERWGIRPPLLLLTTPFTISRWPMRRRLTEERRWRRSDGNSCALWMLTARLPELYWIVSKLSVFWLCFCVLLKY